MNRIGVALGVFLVFMLMSIVCTVVVYFMVFVVISRLASTCGLADGYSWLPLAGTILVFLVAVVTVIRNRAPEITRLKWDSGTSEDGPSQVSLHGWGGRFWNVNPLGPQSISSIGAIGGAILCAGPSLAVSAFVAAVGILGDDKETGDACE